MSLCINYLKNIYQFGSKDNEFGVPVSNFNNYYLALDVLDLIKKVDVSNIQAQTGYIHAKVNSVKLDHDCISEWEKYTSINQDSISSDLVLNILEIFETLMDPFREYYSKGGSVLIPDIPNGLMNYLLHDDMSDTYNGKSVDMLVTTFLTSSAHQEYGKSEQFDRPNVIPLSQILNKFKFLLDGTKYGRITKKDVLIKYTNKYIHNTAMYIGILYKLTNIVGSTALTKNRLLSDSRKIEDPYGYGDVYRHQNKFGYLLSFPFVNSEAVLLVDKELYIDKLPPQLTRVFNCPEAKVFLHTLCECMVLDCLSKEPERVAPVAR